MSNRGNDFDDAAEAAPETQRVQAASLPPAESLGKKLARITSNPAFRTRALFLGGAVVVFGIVLFTFVRGRGETGNSLPDDARGVQMVDAPAPDEPGASGPMAASADYRKMVADVEAGRASAAESTGKSSMASTASLELGASGNTQAPNLNGAAQGAVAGSGGQQAQPDPANDQRIAEEQRQRQEAYEREVERTRAYMKSRRDAWAPKEAADIIDFGAAAMVNSSPAMASTGGQASTGGDQTAAPAAKPLILVAAGSKIAAVTDNACNTDYNVPMVATIATGRLKDAKLIGTCTRVEDEAVIQFTSISVPGIGSIGAQAFAVNPSTNEAGVATDVDHKLVAKYLFGTLAKGIAAVGEAARNSSTNTVIVNGAVTTSTPELSNKRARQIMGGAIADQASKDLSSGNTNPTARVKAKQMVSVYFVTDVAMPAN